MLGGSSAAWMLAQEARALLTRLDRVKPFALHETMVPAASVSSEAQRAIEGLLYKGRRELRIRVRRYMDWVTGPLGRLATPEQMQERFTFLRLRFNSVLTQFDIFADVLTQRSEHETGVWLAGLDTLAADALAVPGGYFMPPPVICYLDRGHGAAIRRARTRLAGGAENPVAVIRVPRERMIGSGIGSSLIHEIGHQGAALLDLVNSLRPVLQGMQRGVGELQVAWQLYERWISEIVADFWSVARLGISATTGLMAVVSLPRPFVFRIDFDDPHPAPWIRLKLSAALGGALYPHPQWQALARLWESFYPLKGLDDQRRAMLENLETAMPALVSLLVNHRPTRLRGRTLGDVLHTVERQPEQLRAYYRAWGESPAAMKAAPPSLVFAVIGQARAAGEITPAQESSLLAGLLTHWALRRTLGSVDSSDN